MRSTSKRLAMVLKGYPRISETFISNEILHLERSGIDIAIFSLRQPRESFAHKHVKQIRAPVTYLPEYILPSWKTLFRANFRYFLSYPYRYLRSFSNALKASIAISSPLTPTVRHFLQAGYLVQHDLFRKNIAHIHAHFAHTPTSVALYASELTGISFSFTAHAKDIYTSHPAKLMRKIARARFIITCTEYNRQYLLSLAEGLSTPIYTIYHGIDLSRFEFGPDHLPSPPFRILSVGRLVKKKGYDDLLKALRILKTQQIPFEFFHVGDGDLREQIHKMAGDLGLLDNVHFLGTLTHEDLIPLYRRSHLFVLASKIAPDGDRDGLPNVILEAMAIGIPVVATNVSAIPEAVHHEKTGILVSPENPYALAQAIKRVLFSPGDARSMVFEARRFVESYFDSAIWMPRLYRIFRDVVRNDYI
ncbi:MAG: glycosyltransferase family 4 protein [Thermodesulforhabdaceae bacterium]